MTTVLDLNVPPSKAPYKKVSKVRFTVLNAQEIEQMSVCEVVTTQTYTEGLPTYGGVNDPRMGPIGYNVDCETCLLNMEKCPGHFGHIKLARPMYNWGFLKTTLQCLRCVCHYCSRLLIPDADLNLQKALQTKNMKQRLGQVASLCRSKKRCPGQASNSNNSKQKTSNMSNDTTIDNMLLDSVAACGYAQPRYVQEGAQVYVIYPEDDNNNNNNNGLDRKRLLTGETAFKILSKISLEDKQKMGFLPGKSDPSWLVLTNFPVPPMTVRPTVSFGTDRSEDDLTAKLLDLLKANETLKKHLEQGSGEYVCSEFGNLLQYHIYTICDNNIQAVPQATTKSQKPIKSIRERLKGKEGRLRGHLMGKRVNFSARTVIGGDPMLDIDQVGVPRSIAFNLTFPERVSPITYEKLLKAVQNGPTEYPGAKFIIKKDGSEIDLRYNENPKLEIGDKVERHMLDGDYVIFNRQPSLHKMSMMGHRAKILPYSTFRLNLSATSPYNADFDGDEMNLHLAQSHETRAEIKHIMLVPKQMVSPQGNKPVMGVVQDSCLAVSKFTKRDQLMKRDQVFGLLMTLPNWDGTVPIPCIIRPEPMWSGKQLFSLLLKKKMNVIKSNGLEAKNKNDDNKFSSSDHRVIIRDGEVVCGNIDKKIVGSQSGGILHLTWLDHGPEHCKILISYIQKLVNAWLLHHSFTCGTCDIVANDETMFRVAETLRLAKDSVAETMGKAQRGLLESQPGKTMYESFESAVNRSLNSAREDAGRIGSDSLDERNNIIAMVQCGSKGSNINVAQIIACVGQQNVEGKRITNGFRDRTLPHFPKDDYGPESRGFVENSYLGGLTPEELYFHAMGGREGVIDTAVKTSETGYIQRRLVKSMETLKVCYDGTVRDENDYIIQFLYGEDGMAAEYIEDQDIELIKFSHSYLEKNYKHNHYDENYGKIIKKTEIQAEIQTEPGFVDLQGNLIEFKLIKNHQFNTIINHGNNTNNHGSNTIHGSNSNSSSNNNNMIRIDKFGNRLDKDGRIIISGLDEYWLLGKENEKWLEELKSGKRPDDRKKLDEEFFIIQEAKRKLCCEIYKDGEIKQHLPIPIDRLVRQAQMNILNIKKIKPENDIFYTPIEIIDKVNILMEKLKTLKGLNPSDQLGQEVLYNSMIVLNAHIRSRLNSRRLLEQDKLNKQSIDWLLGEIELRFEKSLAVAGEMVGTIAAQSVGEPATQMTLNTFHFAGVGAKNVTLGVPRLKEIINVAKTVKTPSLTIFLRKDIGSNRNLAKDTQASIEYTTLEKVTSFSQIFYDQDPTSTIIPEDEEWVSEYYELPAEDDESNISRLSPWLLRIQLDQKVMTDRKLRMRDIGERINSDFLGDLSCIQTDDNASELVLRLRIVKDNNATNNDFDIEDEDRDCRFLKNIERDILKDMVLKGISGIRKVFMREESRVTYDNTIGEFPSRKKESPKEWILDSEGCNLEEVLQHENVDHCRTTSNDIVEIMQTLGVEAVRKKLQDEVKLVISFDGSYVNYRHLSILCDTMSNRGHLMAISRHGVNRGEHSPLMKCSFEETVEMLMDASMFGVIDNCRGVSENIILGQLPRIGTNEFDILVDDSKDPITQRSLLDKSHPLLPSKLDPFMKKNKKDDLLIDGGDMELVDSDGVIKALEMDVQTPLFFADNFTTDPLKARKDAEARAAREKNMTIGGGWGGDHHSSGGVDYGNIQSGGGQSGSGAGGVDYGNIQPEFSPGMDSPLSPVGDFLSQGIHSIGGGMGSSQPGGMGSSQGFLSPDHSHHVSRSAGFMSNNSGRDQSRSSNIIDRHNRQPARRRANLPGENIQGSHDFGAIPSGHQYSPDGASSDRDDQPMFSHVPGGLGDTGRYEMPNFSADELRVDHGVQYSPAGAPSAQGGGEMGFDMGTQNSAGGYQGVTTGPGAMPGIVGTRMGGLLHNSAAGRMQDPLGIGSNVTGFGFPGSAQGVIMPSGAQQSSGQQYPNDLSSNRHQQSSGGQQRSSTGGQQPSEIDDDEI